MGQKIHPIGFRVGFFRDWDSRWYANKQQYADLLHEDLLLRKKIREMYPQAGISRIEIERLANRVKVILHAARPGMIIGRGRRGIEELTSQLESLVNREIIPDIKEIRNPELDAQLVAEGIAQQIEKRIAYKRAMRQALLRAIRSGARGIKIQCKGRLAGAEMARSEVMKEGKIPLQTMRADIDYGFAEAKTTYGQIGVKVWIYKGDILPETRHMLPERPERPVRPVRPERPVRAEQPQRTARRGRPARSSAEAPAPLPPASEEASSVEAEP